MFDFFFPEMWPLIPFFKILKNSHDKLTLPHGLYAYLSTDHIFCVFKAYNLFESIFKIHVRDLNSKSNDFILY